MKMIAALLITMIAGIANAGYIVWDYPVINGLSIDNACHTAETFKSLKPITYCTETAVVARYACRFHGELGEVCRKLRPNEQPTASEYLREETACVAHASKHIEVSRYVTSEKCVKWTPPSESDMGECLEWKTVTEFAGTRYNVQGHDLHGEGQTYNKRVDVPACR